MSKRSDEDRALNAVRRVRDSREQDSRFGLQHALNAAGRREVELSEARDRRAAAAPFTAGSTADFAQHLAHVAGLADLEALATDRVETSRLVADEATRRWQHDRQQVRVVDLLLERRAEQRAEERRRHEAHELDDLATQAWLRTREVSA
jgi:flagellar biosynthesis chaperone FliJ